MPGTIKKYSDIDLNFNPNPISGDVTVLKDAEAIKRSVKNLLLTNYYERPFKSNFGGNLTAQLFENFTHANSEILKTQILTTLKKHENRISVIGIKVNANEDENRYDVSVTFAIDAISEIVSVNLFLERTR
jgi:phage baseplate assembly protein W